MGVFGTVSAVIRIIDWAKDKYENVKTYIKKWRRRRTAKAVRRAIDSNDKSAVAKRVRKVIKKRQDRGDSG